jgi:8-amino-7-oxononanoate synthase
VPLANEWEDAPFLTHIVPIRTRPRYNLYLFFQLMLKNMNAYPMSFPIVPKGKDIIRLVFHVHNTTDQVEVLVECIMAWAVEMMAIEKGKGGLPRAAREVYALSE